MDVHRNAPSIIVNLYRSVGADGHLDEGSVTRQGFVDGVVHNFPDQVVQATLGGVTDNGDGTYTATLTSSATAGTATVTGTLNGVLIVDDATVTFTVNTPDPAVAVAEFSYTVEAGSGRRRNKGKQAADANMVMQQFAQPALQLYQAMGLAGPYNAMIRMMGEAYDIARVDDFMLEAIPEGATLFINNHDRPGVVGMVGQILGEAGVNISRMQLALSPESKQAAMLVNIDSAPVESVLENLRGHADVISAQVLEL